MNLQNVHGWFNTMMHDCFYSTHTLVYTELDCSNTFTDV